MGDRLQGKRVLITGVASGIGAACAQRFHSEGARIAGMDLAPAPDDVELVGFCKLAVRDEDEVRAGVDAAANALGGGIDVLVNAAGVAGGAQAHQLELEEWRRVIDINLTGTFLTSKHVVARMAEAGSGNIINLASVEGLMGGESMASYNASKGGVVLLTRSMALDYGPRNVRVNAICPGFIRTAMTAPLDDPAFAAVAARIAAAHALGRLGEADEVANAALFLASDEASFVTGAALTVDGGFTAGKQLGINDALMEEAAG
jgi:NAD(P)-dependent dehydrogenase (short-subunit alcohol dehydrogenase family)